MIRFGWMGVLAPLFLLACGSASAGDQTVGQGGAGGSLASPVGGATQVPLPDVARSALAYDSAPSVDPATEAALVGDLNNFGLQVFQVLAPSDQNFVVSPVSGFVALTMASAGAQEATADEMKAVLYPDVPLSNIHPATNQLEQRVRGYAQPAVQTSDGEKKVEMNLANADFVQQGFAIEQSFLDTLSVSYNCGVELVDYKNAPEAASSLINNWVAQQTNDRIQNLLSGALDPLTRLVLVNALYMYASWNTAFNPQVTHPQPFHGVGGDASPDFMHTELTLNYATGTGWAGVDVPYYGGSLVFTAVLPDQGQFDTVKAAITGAWFTGLDATSQSQQVGLSIPKFKLAGQTVSWQSTLRGLGMSTLFDPDTCNLKGITTTEPLYVSDVLQQVFVEIAEKGTEAAAATAVVVNTSGMPDVPPVSMVLDRPFLFFIRERGGPVLFAGQVMTLPAN
jgi:serpin B